MAKAGNRKKAHSPVSRFFGNTSGQTAIIFAFAFVPMLGFVGVAIDYSRSTATLSQLNAAADAAALYASVQTKNSPSHTPPSTAAVRTFFNSAAGNGAGVTINSFTVTPTTTGTTFSVQVDYTASLNTALANVIGINTMSLSGTSTASTNLPPYLDFYLALDVSGSMGLPSTAAGATLLRTINPDMRANTTSGCEFACHYAGSVGFTLSRTNNIQLRIDAVQNAVANLINTAVTDTKVANQYRVGLYPFVVQAQSLYDISNNLGSALTANAGLANLLDQGDSTKTMQAGGTDFSNVLQTINGKINSVGDGSTITSTKPFIFLVTDGMQNAQRYYNSTGFTGSTPSTIDPAKCAALKARGVVVSVLYIPYLTLPANDLNPANLWNNETGVTNTAIPTLGPALQTCASPGFFYTANTPQDITASMNAMFAQANQYARLTK